MAPPAIRFDDLEVTGLLLRAIVRRDKRLYKKLPPLPPPASRRGGVSPTYHVPYIKPVRALTKDHVTTFHMAHSVITNDFTTGRKLRTMQEAAEGHGDYIDRDSATEKIDVAALRNATARHDEIPELQRYSDYLDDGEIDTTRHGSLAFGTIGNTRQERRDFWRAVGAIERAPKCHPGVWIHPERNPNFWQIVLDPQRDDLPAELSGDVYEAIVKRGRKFRLELSPDRIEAITEWASKIAKNSADYDAKLPSIAVSWPRGGRLQMRLIVELPHEVSPVGRYEIARNFSKIFEERGLPYWTVGHRPAPFGDERNYHLHIAYYDRPCRRLEDGSWDLQKQETIRLPNGEFKTTYPLVPPKDRGAQGRDWMLALRNRYAEEANRVLAREGATKRYTPKSYAALGIQKTPGIHISQAAFNLERQGVATEEGRHNRMAQIAWEQRLARELQEDRVEPILKNSANSQTKIAQRPGGKLALDVAMSQIAGHEQTIIANAQKSAALAFESRSRGGYVEVRERFMATLLSQLNQRPAKADDAGLAIIKPDTEFQRITRLLIEARQASSEVDRERFEVGKKLRQLHEESNSAAESLAQLLMQLDRQTATTETPRALDEARDLPVATAPKVILPTAVIPNMTKLGVAELLRLSQDEFTRQARERVDQLHKLRRAGQTVAAAEVTEHLNLYRQVADMLSYDLVGGGRATPPLTPKQIAELYRLDIPFDALHPQIRARLPVPPNLPGGTRPSDLTRSLQGRNWSPQR